MGLSAQPASARPESPTARLALLEALPFQVLTSIPGIGAWPATASAPGTGSRSHRPARHHRHGRSRRIWHCL